MNDLNFSPSELNRDLLPLVAVAGRPNVGKSTLFNRLIGKRKAITDEVAGVTRDPVFEQTDLDGVPLLLADTGGYKPDMEGLDSQVVDKSLELIQAADLVVLVTDVSEILAEDEELVKRLRPFSEKIILAVNKVDNTSREDDVWNYYSFGFDTVIPVSAEHGSNIMELEEQCAIKLRELVPGKIAEAEEVISSQGDVNFECMDIRLSILGQPNTGKSTLSNILTGEKRSIVSDVAGTTRDIIEGAFKYKGRHFYVADTAGIRRKKKVGENVEYYSVNRAISSIDDSDIVLLMIDADKGLSEQDKKIAQLIVRQGKGVVLVLNKWDLLEKVANQEDAVKDRIRFLFPILNFAPVIPLSALKEDGVPRLLNTIISLFNQLNRRVETSRLNSCLDDWLFDYQPPRRKNFRYKVKYMTQTGVNPVHFIVFVNRVKGFPADWVQFLKNKIRKDLGYYSIPIAIDLKDSGGKK